MAALSLDDQLITAASSGDVDTVQDLLAQGAKPYYQEEGEGKSPLIVAAAGGHEAVVNALLLAGAPWNAYDRSGKNAGDYALANGHQAIVDRLVNAGVEAELIFRALKEANREPVDKEGVSERLYLSSEVRYEGGNLLDEADRGVMMEWEKPLMQAHAQILCMSGGDVLNVGFGLGLVDTAIQAHNPKSHTIIEAHPQVYQKLVDDGWTQLPNVNVVFGRWQDVVGDLGDFDSVFFDTFDDVQDLDEFHQYLPFLVRPGGIYSFFNGICPDSLFNQGVACQLITMTLANMGFETNFIPMDIECEEAKIWEGTAFRYFLNSTYYIPVCKRVNVAGAIEAVDADMGENEGEPAAAPATS